MVRILPAVLLAAIAACGDDSEQRGGLFASDRPDEPPVVVNKSLPFRYPAQLYARKVQGNVTLRLYVDRDGRVRADSTRVEESSGFPPLDSAAVVGSEELQFVPAKQRGEPIGVVVLFPVYFRHPEAPPLPGDSILKNSAAARDSGKTNSPRR
jgi:TonB family protein